MNTIEEILRNKKESIYETYARILCPKCENKNNDKDLCKITIRLDNSVKCDNYKICMQNKCNTCKNNKKCWNGTTAKKHKPIMKGII